MAKAKSIKKQNLNSLNRRDLLELLVDEMEENKFLRTQLEEAQAQLEDRKIIMKESGSLAEAAIRLSGLFEAADKAIEIYNENVSRRYGSYSGNTFNTKE